MNFIATDVSSRSISPLQDDGRAGDIVFAIGDCDLGKVLVARSAIGVCAILLGSSVEELEQNLAGDFPARRLVVNERLLQHDLSRIVQFIAAPDRELDFDLDIRGTPFQHRVWDALRTIPAGQPLTYSQLARRVSGPKSLRAIAQACAENPIALAIPCHRVMGQSGSMAGCRWGTARKRTLINREAAAAGAGTVG